nr:hypothetical protein [Brucella intermedia]
MSRYKSIRNPALTEDQKQQLLSRLIALKEVMTSCTTVLEINSEDYKLLDRLSREVMHAGETIAKSRFWGRYEMHSIGGK